MRRPAYNPTRRNRNIGTAKQGRGLDNRLVIPTPGGRWAMYWEDLKNPVAVDAKIRGRSVTILVEPTYEGFAYPCTVEDLYTLLALVPPEDMNELAMIILRQPTRKQRILSDVWGRFIYLAECGRYQGPAICLEAQRSTGTWSRQPSLMPDEQLELERLRADGHSIKRTDRGYHFERNPVAMRATVLFRTVLHELGHLVDWQRQLDEARAPLHSRPVKEKEAFAHRYAELMLQRFRKVHRAPFPPQGTCASARRLGLAPE